MNKTEQSLHPFTNMHPPELTDFPNSFIWPQYEGMSVGNLGVTVAHILGAAVPNALPVLLVSVHPYL